MSRITPKQLALEVRSNLVAAGDTRTAARGLTFFKPDDHIHLYGIKSSGVRNIEKEAFGKVRGEWTVSDSVAFCDMMSGDSHFEAKMVGVLLLGRFKSQFTKGMLATVKRWITEGRFRNWAEIDGVAPTLVAPLVETYPDLAVRVKRWTSSRNMWLRRAAVVTFVPLARRGIQMDQAYGIVEDLLDDGHDLMHKACGWLLREAGKADVARLERFLLTHGPRIPRTTVRYAIERFPDGKRRSLLAQTRGR
jgi:3-methyladenine DNA glycosylase AlkD